MFESRVLAKCLCLAGMVLGGAPAIEAHSIGGSNGADITPPMKAY
jgi:hypothetical protein